MVSGSLEGVAQSDHSPHAATLLGNVRAPAILSVAIEYRDVAH